MIRRDVARRRLQRGAAFAEAAVIAANMVVVLACMWYAFDIHRSKIAVMEQARAEAWSPALNYCKGVNTTGGGSDFMGDINDTTSQTGSDSSNPGDADDYIGTSNKISSDEGYYSHEVSQQVKPGSLPVLTGKTMMGKMYIRCNEEPKPGGLLKLGADLVLEAAGSFKDKFSPF